MDIVKFNDGSVEKEILNWVAELPFENSHCQTRSVIDSSITPQRAAKTIGIRLMKRLNDLKVCGIKREQTKNEVDLLMYERMNLEYKGELLTLHQRRIDLLIQEKTAGFAYEDKLAEDCKAELSYLYSLMHKLPKYTREQFEEAEQYWLDCKINAAEKHLPEPKTKGLAHMLEEGTILTVEQINIVRNIESSASKRLINK